MSENCILVGSVKVSHTMTSLMSGLSAAFSMRWLVCKRPLKALICLHLLTRLWRLDLSMLQHHNSVLSVKWNLCDLNDIYLHSLCAYSMCKMCKILALERHLKGETFLPSGIQFLTKGWYYWMMSWLELLLWVFLSGLTLLVGWQKGIYCPKICVLSPKVFLKKEGKGVCVCVRGRKPKTASSLGTLPLKCRWLWYLLMLFCVFCCLCIFSVDVCAYDGVGSVCTSEG